MSMTREETITNLEKLAALFHTESEQSKMVDYSKIIETLEFAAAALRPVSREQVEKVWRRYTVKQKPIELMHYSFGASSGNQCGACCNLREYQYNSRRVRKCTAYGGLHSSKADWAKRWPACGLYGTPVPYQAVSDTAKRTFARIGICHDDITQIDGQTEMEVLKDGSETY